MDRQEALMAVCGYANEHADEIANHDGLTYEKIYLRSEIDAGESRPDRIVFEVERHQRILGCEYWPDEAMDSFMTYWQRFELKPETETLTPLPESRKRTVTVSVDRRAEDRIGSMFAIDFELDDTGSILCTESSCNSERIVSNIGDVREFASEFVEGLCFERELEKISDYLSAEEAIKLLLELKEAYECAAIDKAENAWNHFQKELVDKGL
ncbi:MAG: hypothetical protein QGD90_04840 [Candidatus Hydrogenedentes bacterium]|nr:hypothetical protein [Candidatus Hydrogenedentota bacterium]